VLSFISIVLIPFSWLFAVVVRIRNWCYDAGVLSVQQVRVPVVSVGNMTTGGTGKTPLIEYLIRTFTEMGKTVAVVSRGYGRSTYGTQIVSDGKTLLGNASTAGDEPWQIARKFPGVAVIVDEKKIRAAQLATRYAVNVILLDDGFQHRALKRDMDIVVVDSTMDLWPMRVLPAGHRREPMSSLKRATFLAFSRCSQPQKEHPEYSRFTAAPSCCMNSVPKKLVSLSNNQTVLLKNCAGKSCIAFAGIGNPKSFEETLREIGFLIVEFVVYPDHHRYSESDIDAIREKMSRLHPDMLVTTEKDAMRLLSNHKQNIESLDALFYLTIEQEIIRGESLLRQSLQALFQGSAE
jgi:tetraacyldisaccharide 4'-kinase